MKLVRFEPESLERTQLPELRADEVHLWIFRPDLVDALASNGTEGSRSRAVLRWALAPYAGLAPEQLHFELKGEGKPVLSLPKELHFNLSHSRQVQAVAITRIGEIGVDIEKIRPVRDLGVFSKRFFLPNEREQLEARDEPLRAFFEIWTAKEAWAKSRAESVFRSFSRYDTTSPDPKRMSFEIASDFLGSVVVQTA